MKGIWSEGGGSIGGILDGNPEKLKRSIGLSLDGAKSQMDLPGLSVTAEQVSLLIRPVLERHGVRRASIYGSVVKGTARKDSDVDILVELAPEKSLLDLVALKRDLENVLRRTVDLAEFDTLHPMIKDQVLTEQVAVV